MKYQFCIRFDNVDKNSAANKAVLDCSAILSANRYKDFTLTVGDNSKRSSYYVILLKSLVRFFFAIERHSIICVQYPLLSINRVFKYFTAIARVKNAKTFCIIHDLESLRTGGKDPQAISQEIAALNFYDAIIVHNGFMRDWLYTHGVHTTMIELEIFDYLSADFSVNEINKPTIAYAGNLSKSTFIYSLNQIKNCRFNVYGPNFLNQLAQVDSNFCWQGEYSPAIIPQKLNGRFGLIWDGTSINICDDILGNYLKYNNPHKCSLYIAAGLPVIAPKNSAIGQFIIRHKIGMTISNLTELDGLSIDEQLYQDMRHNILALRQNVITGYYFNRAIGLIEQELCQ